MNIPVFHIPMKGQWCEPVTTNNWIHFAEETALPHQGHPSGRPTDPIPGNSLSDGEMQPLPQEAPCRTRISSQIGLEPTYMTTFYLHRLFKGPSSKYGHILKNWGLGLHINLGEINPADYNIVRNKSSEAYYSETRQQGPDLPGGLKASLRK